MSLNMFAGLQLFLPWGSNWKKLISSKIQNPSVISKFKFHGLTRQFNKPSLPTSHRTLANKGPWYSGFCMDKNCPML